MKKLWFSLIFLLVAPPLAFSLSLVKGWNLISFSGDESISASDFFASRNFSSQLQSFDRVWGWNPDTSKWQIYSVVANDPILSSGLEYENLTTVDPERGYWINATIAVDFSYTEDTSGSSGNSNILLTSWMINTTEGAAHIKENGSAVLVNVQSAELTTADGKEYVLMKATGIPNYRVEATQELITALNSRPKAADGDFASNETTATLGSTINFGQDIGYNNHSGQNCTANEGYGYWPPGPVCPENMNHEKYFPVAPGPATTDCETGLGNLGSMVNGTAVFGWGDGQSYNNQGVWQNLAPIAEAYDVDICGGHAANGEYHHHMQTDCLADDLDDDGDEHSPLYGFAADGYPIYGPWYADGVLAQSCWKTRDYNSTATGCGEDGKRTCLLVDPYDISKGVTDASSAGPDVGATVLSISSNEFAAVSGFYFEDYYYDATCAAQGGQYLDDHNGHDHGDLGYHYHITVTGTQGNFAHAFPFIIGPTFYGQLESNANVMCGSNTGGGTGTGTGNGPPQEAIDACLEKSAGESCSFSGMGGQTVTDTCQTTDGYFACGSPP